MARGRAGPRGHPAMPASAPCPHGRPLALLAVGTMVSITTAANPVTGTLPGGVGWAAAWPYDQLGTRRVPRFVRVRVFLVAGGVSADWAHARVERQVPVGRSLLRHLHDLPAKFVGVLLGPGGWIEVFALGWAAWSVLEVAGRSRRLRARRGS